MGLEETTEKTTKVKSNNNTDLLHFFEQAVEKENEPCLPLAQLIGLLEKRKTFWSPPLQADKITAYSLKMDLPCSDFSSLNFIYLDFIVGKIRSDYPSPEDFPYLNNRETEKARLGRAFRQGLGADCYKLVAREFVGEEKPELRAVHTYSLHDFFHGRKSSHLPIRTLFEEIEKIDHLKKDMRSSDRHLRAAAALELYLLNQK